MTATAAPKTQPAPEQYGDTVQALTRSLVAALEGATKAADLVRYDVEVEAPRLGLNRVQLATGGIQPIREALGRIDDLCRAIEAINGLANNQPPAVAYDADGRPLR